MKKPIRTKLHVATDGRWGETVFVVISYLSIDLIVYVAKNTAEFVKSFLCPNASVEVVEVEGDYDAALEAAKDAVKQGNSEVKENHDPDLRRMIDAVGWNYEQKMTDDDEKPTPPLLGSDPPSSRHDCAQMAHILFQDSAFEGYEDIPRFAVEGYSSLMKEIEDSLKYKSVVKRGPDMIIVPVGSGSLAQAVALYYKGRSPSPRIVTVEPDTAACLLMSLRNGRSTMVPTTDTIVRGMNRGTLSTLAWPILRDAVDIAIAVTEAEIATATEVLDIYTLRCVVGER